MLDYNSIKGLATSVRHGAIALDTSDNLLVIVAVTFGDGQEDLQATDSGVVEVSHTLAARIEDHHCARGLGRKQQRDSPIVCITPCLTTAETVKITQLNQYVIKWRRGWDSNPRYDSSPYTHFPGVRLQPLGHPSRETARPLFAPGRAPGP